MSSTPPPRPNYTGTEPCATASDPDLWFSEKDEPRKVKAAKWACQRCPLIDECREYAVHYSFIGVWGGASEHERRKIRQERGIKALPIVPSDSDVLHEQIWRMHCEHASGREIAIALGVSPRHVVRVLRQLRDQLDERTEAVAS